MLSTWCDFFPGGTLPNKRLDALARRLGDAAEKGGRGSWRGYFTDSPLRKAAYRFVEHPLLDLPTLLTGAISHCGDLVRAHADGTILNVQDTTSVDFTSLRSAKGLGPLESSRAQGFMLHFGLILTEQDVPLGLSCVHVFARDPKDPNKAARRRQLAYDEKESARWWNTVLEAEKRIAAPGKLLHVSDRESFIYTYLTRASEASYRVLVRAKGGHSVEDGKHHLLEALRPEWIDAGTRVVKVPARPARGKTPARAARQAIVRVRYGKFTLKEPHNGKGRAALWGISVLEEIKSGDVVLEPLNWLLVTNDPIEGAAPAHQAVDRYLIRWTIEEFNKGLKTGAKLESLQLESRDAIERALALLMLATLRLLQMMKRSRVMPDEPIAAGKELAEAAEYLHSKALARRGRVPVPSVPTAAWVLLEIAKLGGHSGTKSEGPPGWLLLWCGWRRLQDELRGYRLAVHASAAQQENARKIRG